jgi:uncharacterized membrane protein
MEFNWRAFVAGLVAIVLIDMVYLNIAMPFYSSALADVARDSMEPRHLAVGFLAWPVIVFGIATFVLPLAQSSGDAVRLGAMFGASTYLVYNLTNYAVIKYPGVAAITDSAWGTLLGATVSRIMYEASK